MLWFYWLASRLVDMVAWVLCRREIVGVENVPLSGPVLVISNHLSLADPPLLGATFPRPIRFMAKEELFRPPVISWVVKGYRAYPVRRGEADRQAYQTTLRLLHSGEMVCMFPEGHRGHKGELLPGQPGAAVVAGRAAVPVLPVAVSGTEQLFHWPRTSLRPLVRIVIGRPFAIAPITRGAAKEELAKQTRYMMAKIAELLPPDYRGAQGDERFDVRAS
ncbi:MAG: 1-acyl-sn-glycerol-3-phosphate acyltransferase [Chloroflexi bacterium]|nr:1-acyl-sn-glycerol-3-phosphate acyltransferase [Chloroflexota bacterium]MCL5107704.1 1-acyl-sn-glycerol-3-phosphate acyltransferase [Chloroflexota bacterium]